MSLCCVRSSSGWLCGRVVFHQGEIVLLEIVNQLPVLIADGGQNIHHADAGGKLRILLGVVLPGERLRLLTGTCRRRKPGEDRGE